eukprot:TRINITY_DN64383_c0_g1_i1.p1 TRINITY_DN64383_c0_g1~~TRINITY_DN64383_c0_g1_i1.p1  ORF type:complete len:184 (-),score=21.87 TRINITY_DN64383_c0_g1_i1:67-618(-)
MSIRSVNSSVGDVELQQWLDNVRVNAERAIVAERQAAMAKHIASQASTMAIAAAEKLLEDQKAGYFDTYRPKQSSAFGPLPLATMTVDPLGTLSRATFGIGGAICSCCHLKPSSGCASDGCSFNGREVRRTNREGNTRRACAKRVCRPRDSGFLSTRLKSADLLCCSSSHVEHCDNAPTLPLV